MEIPFKNLDKYAQTIVLLDDSGIFERKNTGELELEYWNTGIVEH